MADGKTAGSVAYNAVGPGYFERRALRRHAGDWSLWALGVGAAISGVFTGWSGGLAAGGFGGLAVATAIVTAMYLGLIYSVAEMASAMPHSGGAYSFGRSAMGTWGGLVAGLAQTMAYVLVPAIVVSVMAAYLRQIFATPGWVDPEWAGPLWWGGLYGLFVIVNIRGAALAFRVAVFAALAALAVLTVFVGGAIGAFDAAALTNIAPGQANIAPDQGGTPLLPNGWPGVVHALPFALWFYLAVDSLPLAAEETGSPRRDLPRGLVLGLLTVILATVLVVVLNSGMGGGAASVALSRDPLLDGFREVFGSEPWFEAHSGLLGLVVVVALAARFHATVFAYGRSIYALSRAGYLPRWLSLTHGRYETPHIALIAGAAAGFALTVASARNGDGAVAFALIGMAVFGALVACAMQCASYLLLRRNLPRMTRPYRSPLGRAGAWIGLLISLAILSVLLADPAYRQAAYGAGAWFAAGLAYFAVYGRRNLVYSPEEAFAEHEREEHGL